MSQPLLSCVCRVNKLYTSVRFGLRHGFLQIEDHYKQETKDYLTTIKRLQDENRKLSNSLTAATERDRSTLGFIYVTH